MDCVVQDSFLPAYRRRSDTGRCSVLRAECHALTVRRRLTRGRGRRNASLGTSVVWASRAGTHTWTAGPTGHLGCTPAQDCCPDTRAAKLSADRNASLRRRNHLRLFPGAREFQGHLSGLCQSPGLPDNPESTVRGQWLSATALEASCDRAAGPAVHTDVLSSATHCLVPAPCPLPLLLRTESHTQAGAWGLFWG